MPGYPTRKLLFGGPETLTLAAAAGTPAMAGRSVVRGLLLTEEGTEDSDSDSSGRVDWGGWRKRFVSSAALGALEMRTGGGNVVGSGAGQCSRQGLRRQTGMRSASVCPGVMDSKWRPDSGKQRQPYESVSCHGWSGGGATEHEAIDEVNAVSAAWQSSRSRYRGVSCWLVVFFAPVPD